MRTIGTTSSDVSENPGAGQGAQPHRNDATPVGTEPDLKAEVRDLNFHYGSFQALKHINLGVARNQVTALIGPSGCGKSTLLRCFNRMHDLYPGNHYQGEIRLYPENVNLVSDDVDPIHIRMRISMVFQKPNPFPKSVFENVAFGVRLRGLRDSRALADRVEAALKSAALWDEVKDRLKEPANRLSGGQQQRLCIARALAADPEIVLFDEPTSALDPIATRKIEELIDSLRGKVTMIIVTHNMQQAYRVSDYTAFMYLGDLVEVNKTSDLFNMPAHKLTGEYLAGHFG